MVICDKCRQVVLTRCGAYVRVGHPFAEAQHYHPECVPAATEIAPKKDGGK